LIIVNILSSGRRKMTSRCFHDEEEAAMATTKSSAGQSAPAKPKTTAV